MIKMPMTVLQLKCHWLFFDQSFTILIQIKCQYKFCWNIYYRTIWCMQTSQGTLRVCLIGFFLSWLDNIPRDGSTNFAFNELLLSSVETLLVPTAFQISLTLTLISYGRVYFGKLFLFFGGGGGVTISNTQLYTLILVHAIRFYNLLQYM